MVKGVKSKFLYKLTPLIKLMKNEYSFMNANELIEAFKEARRTPHREGGGVNYFALDLVLGDYNPRKLSDLANKFGQTNALGYFSEIVEESLPKENLFYDSKSNLRDLSHHLYLSLNPQSEWEHLSLGMPDWAEELVKQSSDTPLNHKWHIYSPLNQNEMTDWFRVYRDDLAFMLQNVS